MVVTKHDALRKIEAPILSNAPDVIDILEWQNPANGDNYGHVVTVANGEGYKLRMHSEKRYLYKIYEAGKFIGNYEVYKGTFKHEEITGEALILIDFEAEKSKLYVKFARVN